MLNKTVIPAYAKVNLHLDIVGVQENGYHRLEMVNSRISLYDEVTCILVKSSSQIKLTCSDPSMPTDASNTAYLAAKRFLGQLHSKDGVAIHIEKNIPHGAGLGGGSSDAAAVLHALNELYQLPLKLEQLKAIGLGIGADVPFFLERGCCYVGGVGERVVPVGLHSSLRDKNLSLVLCSPEFHISTREAYRSWDGETEKHKHKSPRKLLEVFIYGNREQITKNLFNAFESVLFSLHPTLAQIYETYGSLSPRGPILTGSGSNLFSLHLTHEEAEDVCQQLNASGHKARCFELLLTE